MLDGEVQPIYQNLPVAPQIAPFVRRYVFIDAPGDLKDYVRPAPLGYNYVGTCFAAMSSLGSMARKVSQDRASISPRKTKAWMSKAAIPGGSDT